MLGAQTAKTMSGLDYLRAIMTGEIPHPPISRLLGFKLEKIDTGRAIFVLEPATQRWS
jgi:hypothetical protein